MHLASATITSLLQDVPVYGDGTAAAMGGTTLLFILAIAVVCIAGAWKVFTKAGQPGWAVIIPIYNLIVVLKIIGKPLWWLLLYFIPLVNFVIAILVAVELAKRFGKGAGFGLGLVFFAPIFICILGFGSATYTPPPRPAT